MVIPCLPHACTALNHMGMHREKNKQTRIKTKKVNATALEPISFCTISSLEAPPKCEKYSSIFDASPYIMMAEK